MHPIKSWLLALVLIAAANSGCKNESNPVAPTTVASLNLTVGRSWTYSYVSTLTDSAGTDSVLYTDTLHVRLLSVNDSLGAMRGLVRYESWSEHAPTVIERIWYRSGGDSLAEVAANAVSHFATPKRRGRLSGAGGIDLDAWVFHPSVLRFTPSAFGHSDTVVVRTDPRIVYRFPLSNGKQFRSFQYPFLENREVKELVPVMRAGKAFFCARILTSAPTWGTDVEWYDDVAAEGLIGRTVRVYAVLTSIENPEGTGMHVTLTQTYSLIGY